MGAREVLLAAALMAMVHRSLALSGPECHMDVIENGTTVSYFIGHGGYKEYCPNMTECSYGLTRSTMVPCCYVCAKGPGESCGGWFGLHGLCSSGLQCQKPPHNPQVPTLIVGGTCVNQTITAEECPSPWFLLNDQCFRVYSGEDERRSSASANAYCGNLTTPSVLAPLGSNLAQPNNLTALTDYLQGNYVDDRYWLGVTGSRLLNRLGPLYGSSDVEDCTELWPGNGLGYGVYYLNEGSCMKKLSFICERYTIDFMFFKKK